MTELKTLEDLGNPRGEFFDEETLREEAVKDIKAVRRGELVPDDVVEYIKLKNNLTEEDLE